MLLTIMNQKWSELGIEEWFVDVHHASLAKSKKHSFSLKAFVDYCDHKRLKGQNARTVERALEVTRYVKKGIPPNTAIRIAWDNYPLVKV
jgi:hypothetical protein